jgi:NAD(P)-dependent dehydrogenase (short-subunit alcohol dehydrogenase family)
MTLNPPLRDWRGKTAWVVGASSGIGLAVARALLAEGATVYLSARRAPELRAAAAGFALAVPLPLDVTDPGEVHAAAGFAFGNARLDLVVHCAAAYTPMRAQTFDAQVAHRHMQVNYGGALNLLDAVLPRLLRQGDGHLSLVASVAGYRGLPRALAYGPTKAALIHLAETLHMDLRPLGVGVSVVNPGFVRTPLTAGNEFPMPALMAPEDAARAMLAGWRRGAFEIHFPRRFTLAMKALSLLPFGAYQALVRRATGSA